jgi:3-methylcrotonyl-CoA carboxylase beta subunit
VTDQLADNDQHALALARAAVSRLNRPKKITLDVRKPLPPKYAAEEIYGIIPKDPRLPFDVREIIARLVDNSEFDEFKPLYGATLVCGFAHWWGYPVGLSPITVFCLASRHKKARILLNYVVSAAFPLSFCKTSLALWSVKNTKKVVLPNMAQKW